MKNSNTPLNFLSFPKSCVFIAFFALFSFNTICAQSNSIKEVRINNDGFNELRSLVINNFDFTTPNLAVGTNNAKIEFDVAENGKISNIKVKGDCKYVDLELENVMKNLVYKIDKDNVTTRNMLANHYVMPVTVYIAEN